MNREAALLHQVHPAKLSTDLTADVASTALLWQRRVPAALAAGLVPPVIASTILMRRDLTWLRRTRRGRYMLTHMPASAQAVRLAGQLLAWTGAYRRNVIVVALGHVIIALGWSSGLWNGGRS
ncbi:MAG: hypothetical protein BGN98_11835 [Microbacterium sp. 69-7]|uniref:hypothetical protein n=1 Tax=Microbacterium sp. 69-7 TaxID=1895784 RepID=UPI000965D466|nr:hypothetical protein [Microbacterium sp. 69-7]OJU46218.1 MAG: hypothetical protein BGN98_11835 [Microbacterium sp. 69-7]